MFQHQRQTHSEAVKTRSKLITILWSSSGESQDPYVQSKEIRDEENWMVYLCIQLETEGRKANCVQKLSSQQYCISVCLRRYDVSRENRDTFIDNRELQCQTQGEINVCGEK